MSISVNISRAEDAAAREDVIHPGKFISKTILTEMSQTELAEKLGVSRQIISMLVTGKRPLTAAMAMRLGSISNKDPRFWMDLQDQWNSWEQSAPGKEILREERREKALNRWDLGGCRILTGVEIEQAIEYGFLEIEGFEKENVKAASYDFRLGQLIEIKPPPGESKRQISSWEQLSSEEGAMFRENSLVQAETYEKVKMHRRLCGRLGAPTSIIQHGIFYSLGLQIDPLFSGPIQFLMENRSDSDLSVHADDVILSCEFIYLASDTHGPSKPLMAGTPDGPFGHKRN